MKHLLVASLVILFTATSFAFKVDVEKSKVTWTGSKVVGSKHTGNLNIKEAKLTWKGDAPSKGKVVIDMTTITNTDLKDKKWNKKLVDHLKSNDFFAVGEHSTSELEITEVKKTGDDKYTLKGELSLKGQKQPVTVRAVVVKSSKKSKLVKATFTFDRTKFGIKYGSGKFFTDLGDKMISDEVTVVVDLHLNKG